jgi:hypothetical protein
MNRCAALGAYAAIQRELGEPLRLPGTSAAPHRVHRRALVAAAIEWSWREPRASGEAFNLANGDVSCGARSSSGSRRVRDEARRIGRARAASPLAKSMPEHAGLWREIAERESLRIADLDALIGLSWQYADILWAAPTPPRVPMLVSTIKARRLGFAECIDSEECIVEHLRRDARAALLCRALGDGQPRARGTRARPR